VLCHETCCAEYWHHEANMSRDPAFMLKSALGVLSDYRDDAERRGHLSDYWTGVEGWKRHYVEIWVRGAKRSFRSAIASAPAMTALAPRRMAREARRFFLDRLR
jgi:hypothetical protein